MHSARRAAHTVTRPELIVTETLNERTLLPGHPVQLAAPQRFLDSTPSTVGASIVRSFAGEVVALPRTRRHGHDVERDHRPLGPTADPPQHLQLNSGSMWAGIEVTLLGNLSEIETAPAADPPHTQTRAHWRGSDFRTRRVHPITLS